MKIPETTTQATSWVFTPVAVAFIQDSIRVMIPWMITLFVFVLADLASGKRKSHLLGIHFAWSTAVRETVGKIVVYVAGVLAFAMLDVAMEGNLTVAKWCCLILIVVEGGSFVSNLLAPYGIKLSLKGLLKMLLKKSPLEISDEDADEIIKVQKRENKKWNMRKYSGDKPVKRTKVTTEQILEETFAREGWGAAENIVQKEEDENGKTYYKIYGSD